MGVLWRLRCLLPGLNVRHTSLRFRRKAALRAASGESSPTASSPSSVPSAGTGKIKRFTLVLLLGLTLSQIAPLALSPLAYARWERVVEVITMVCLSYIMISVGYEFELDKSNLRACRKDYLIACVAAALPWILVSIYLKLAFPGTLTWSFALLMGRFAAPTSAGILFSMLEAAGLKQTWLFAKARVLAIFDDLDTILLMIPLKMCLVGFKWELTFDAILVTALLGLTWFKLHAIRLPRTWGWTMFYGALITLAGELIEVVTHGRLNMEVLLPAFCLGCMIFTSYTGESGSEGRAAFEEMEAGAEKAKDYISTAFMLLVGLSMPSTFVATCQGACTPPVMAFHIFMVTLFMTLGKMFLVMCYKKEVKTRTRLALSLGMCPRGEVGAGIIAISLGLGVRGPAVTVAVLSLALNLLLSSLYIIGVIKLLGKNPEELAPPSEGSATATAAKGRMPRQRMVRTRGSLWPPTGFARPHRAAGLAAPPPARWHQQHFVRPLPHRLPPLLGPGLLGH